MKSNNLTTSEQIILNNLNTRALLIVEFEKIMQEAKIPYDSKLIYQLPDNRIVELIENWNPENQDKMRKNFTVDETKKGNQHIKNVFKSKKDQAIYPNK